MKKNRYSYLIIFIITISIIYSGCGGGSTKLAQLSSSELFVLGKEKYEAKKHLKAIGYFQSVVYNYPGESIIDTAQYYLALSYFGNEDYELAQVEFNRLVLNYPSSVYFEHGIFMKAVCFYEGTPTHFGLDQSDLKIAIKQFEDFLIDFPESVVIEDVKAYLLKAQTRMAHKFYYSAITYKNIGAYKSAEIYFQKVIDDYTDTEYASSATFGLANMKFKQKKYTEAKNKFSDFITVFTDHEFTIKAKELVEESSFKSGEVAFEKGEFDNARKIFESVKEDYPLSKYVDKADKYLIKINNLSAKE